MLTVWMFVNVDWFFVSHRLPIAREAEARGVCMTVFADTSNQCPNFTPEGFEFRKSPIRRQVRFYFLILDFLKSAVIIFQERPDVLHAVTVKPILIIGVVARVLGIPFIASVSGLGPAFSAEGPVGRIRRALVISIYRFVFGGKNSSAIVQTDHDRNAMLSSLICQESQLQIIRGSGIKVSDYELSGNADVRNLEFSKEKKIRILMASRMLSDKGVIEYLHSAAVLSEEMACVEWLLAGPFDEDSPTSLSSEVVLSECVLAGVKYLGNVDNMPELLSTINLFVYPSYYPEGLPKILLEVAAAGVPVITTDHPGCRDAIVVGRSGLLAKPRDTEDLTRVTRHLIDDKPLRGEMQKFSSIYAKENFDVSEVINQHYKLYDTAVKS